MKKKLISSMLALAIMIGISSMAFATAEFSPSILIEDKEIELGGNSFIDDDGLLMLPLRPLFEKLGYLVEWNKKDQSVDLSREGKDILLKKGSNDFQVNGEEKNLYRAPIIRDSRTFVPVELVDKSLDAVLGWNSRAEEFRLKPIKDEDVFVISEDKATRNELDNYMNKLVEHENFHGSVLVAEGGEILLNKGYGYSDFQQNIQNKSQTRFAIGSVTKQFTAFSIMKLKEDGLIDIDGKISNYISDVPYGDKISIYNLLTHTSGLKNYTDLQEFFSVDLANRNPMKMLDLIRGKDLNFNPGEAFEYSNTNYLILGMIIENISGESFEDCIYSTVNPLGLKDTGLIYGERKGVNDATPYTGYLETTEIDDDLVLSQAYAAGSMYSTVEDLYKWSRLINTNQIVNEETKEEMFEEHVSIPGSGSYGYGWMVENTQNGKEVFHGGNTLGSTAYLGSLEEQDISVVILTNNGGYNTNDLKENLYSIVLGENYELPKELEEIDIKDPDLYSNYTGEYEFINNTKLNIIERDGKLYGQVTGQGTFELFPKSKTEFFARSVDVNIEFITDKNGKATELKFSQAGLEFTSKRAGDEEEHVEVDVSPDVYDDYIGEYEMPVLGEGVTIKITRDEDKLFAQLTGQDKFQIFPSSETEFFYKVVDAQIVFEKDENGEVSNLVLHQMGQEFRSAGVK